MSHKPVGHSEAHKLTGMMTLEGYLQKKFRSSFEDSRRPLRKSASFRSLKSVKSRLSGSRCSLKLQKSELSFGSRTSLDSSFSSTDSCPGSSSYSCYSGPSRAVITQVIQIKRTKGVQSNHQYFSNNDF